MFLNLNYWRLSFVFGFVNFAIASKLNMDTAKIRGLKLNVDEL